MAISLYDVTVQSYLQTLGGVAGFMDRGLKHCTEKNVDPAEIVGTRLFDDMLPFSYQINAVVGHSLGAIEGAKAGVINPPRKMDGDYPALQKLVADTISTLEQIKPAEINALEGKDVTFEMGDMKIPFTAENYFLSFSLPNFHFHATTAYDILRTKGVSLGKRNYLGQLRMKAPA
ncbi:MAG: DUF1993 domain-containing protein [Alphaproteobacteria bacterium]